MKKQNKKISHALLLAHSYGQHIEADRKAWCIDQMVRVLIGDDQKYQEWVRSFEEGGDEAYFWDEGEAP